MSNDYKNLSGVVEGCGFLKKDINANTCRKHVSHNYSNSKGKYNCGNIEGIGRVHFNK